MSSMRTAVVPHLALQTRKDIVHLRLLSRYVTTNALLLYYLVRQRIRHTGLR